MDIETDIINNFKDSKYNVLILNKRLEKDIDIVFFTDDIDRINTYQNVTDFIQRFRNTSLVDSFFLLHDHRNFGIKKKFIHLLYYPSIYFLKYWELPSFHKSILDTSKVIHGNTINLIPLANDYLNRVSRKQDLYDVHLSNYTQIAIHNLFYIKFSSDIYSIDTIIENLLYIFKYYSIELLLRSRINIEINDIWDWNKFTDIFAKCYPNQYGLIDLFQRKINNSLNNLTKTEIIEYYFDFIRIISTNKPDPLLEYHKN